MTSLDSPRAHSPHAWRVGGLLAIGLLAIAGAATANAADFSGNATLTSDYVWRGSTQTQGNPAVQAGFAVVGSSGFYGSIWGSNVDFGPAASASTELDFTVGWGHSVNDDWAVDVNVLHYRYPSTTVDLDWTELNGTLNYKGNYWLSVGYSPEALGYDKAGVYTLVGARFPVNDRFRFEAALGHYFLSDEVVAKRGYTHGLVSAIWTFKAPFEARLTAHATDADARDIFGDDFAGSRIEAAVQASF